jgi:hypothetical protein
MVNFGKNLRLSQIQPIKTSGIKCIQFGKKKGKTLHPVVLWGFKIQESRHLCVVPKRKTTLFSPNSILKLIFGRLEGSIFLTAHPTFTPRADEIGSKFHLSSKNIQFELDLREIIKRSLKRGVTT